MDFPSPWTGGRPAGHISRQGKAWRVIFNFLDNDVKNRVSGFFSDSKHGGREQAHEVAQAWRRETSDKLGMTVNEYRFTAPEVIEVKLSNSGTMLTDAVFLSVVNSNRWFVDGKGYVECSDGTKFHREITGYAETDHINRQRTDNRLANLREVTRQENTNNMSMKRNNTSGENGVHLQRNGNGSYSWCSRWYEEGKSRTISFSATKYGFERAKALAIEARHDANTRIKCFNGMNPPTLA